MIVVQDSTCTWYSYKVRYTYRSSALPNGSSYRTVIPVRTGRGPWHGYQVPVPGTAKLYYGKKYLSER